MQVAESSDEVKRLSLFHEEGQGGHRYKPTDTRIDRFGANASGVFYTSSQTASAMQTVRLLLGSVNKNEWVRVAKST